MKKKLDDCIFCSPDPCDCNAKPKPQAKKRAPKAAEGVKPVLAATAPPSALKPDVKAAMRQAARPQTKEEIDEELVTALSYLEPILSNDERVRFKKELETPLSRKIRWKVRRDGSKAS